MQREKGQPEQPAKRVKDEPKKEKKKHRKHHRSSSDARSSRSKSRSRSRSPKEKRPTDGQPLKSAQSRTAPFPARRGRVNSNLLTHIISDHKKINRKLDSEQIQRAASKFKQNFTEQISPVTMSAFLSNQALQRQVQAKQLSPNYECRICGASFENGCDFTDHMQSLHRNNP